MKDLITIKNYSLDDKVFICLEYNGKNILEHYWNSTKYELIITEVDCVVEFITEYDIVIKNIGFNEH